MLNVSATKEALAELKKLQAMGNIITPQARWQAQQRLIESIRQDFASADRIRWFDGTILLRLDHPSLVPITEWILGQAERGEIQEAGSTRVGR